MPKKCPGGKIRIKGKGRGLGIGKGRGPRPSRHYRRVRTKKGMKRVLVNPNVKKRVKRKRWDEPIERVEGDFMELLEQRRKEIAREEGIQRRAEHKKKMDSLKKLEKKAGRKFTDEQISFLAGQRRRRKTRKKK